MKRWWLSIFLLIWSVIFNLLSVKAHKKSKVKNPDVLKEFRSFADSVIPEVSHQIAILVPEKKTKEVKQKMTPITRELQKSDDIVYVDEPIQKVTKKITLVNGEKSATKDASLVSGFVASGSGRSMKQPGISVASRKVTKNTAKADDDEIDTYIDEKEQKSVPGTVSKKRKYSSRKIENEGGSEGPRKSHKVLVKHHQKTTTISGARNITNNALAGLIGNRETSNKISSKVVVKTMQKESLPLGSDTAEGLDSRIVVQATPLETKLTAPVIPENQQCIETCPATCAPQCTPQCCTESMAPPPDKKARTPSSVSEKKVRWYERPRYEPGPNVPPPLFPVKPAESCESTCSRSCTPSCSLTCCGKKPGNFMAPVIGCSAECTPFICKAGCPAHCCAHYVRKSAVNA